MPLFERRQLDPIEVLNAKLAGLRPVWEMYDSMPPKQRQNALPNIPAGLREDYRSAKAADVLRADGLMA